MLYLEFLFYLVLSTLLLIGMFVILLRLRQVNSKTIELAVGIIIYVLICILLLSEILLASSLGIIEAENKIFRSIMLWTVAVIVARFNCSLIFGAKLQNIGKK
ncbi:MAG: hypothetical protein COA91_13280 [Robiginitomaculum sp.]|nr:MAG: hypothetical protein COA91_13280 [Robiginitomaculum sp.]